MKKILFVIVLLTLTTTFSQEKEEEYPQDIHKKQEWKINALTLIAGKWLDVSYEYLINEESSFGVNGAYELGNETDFEYSLTPYYRRYFSDKFARGFFVEGFGMLFSAKDSGFFGNIENAPTETGFALGISAGGKFVSKNGFITELFLGFGRNLIETENNTNEVIGRIGISLGYRF